MKILEMIQKTFSKKKPITRRKAEHSEELTEKYRELLREKEMRLKEQGLSTEELIHELFLQKRSMIFGNKSSPPSY